MNTKLKITSLLVALLFSAGVQAADSAREDTNSKSRTTTQKETDSSDSKRSVKTPGLVYLLQGLSEVFPISDQDFINIWTDERLNPEVMAMINTGGNIVEWGDVQGYREGRLAWLHKRNTPAAARAYAKLNAITSESDIKKWAKREAEATYLQAMHRPLTNEFAHTKRGGRPMIVSAEYLDIWRPVLFSYGWMANNAECALAEKVAPVSPDSKLLPADLVDAFFDLSESEMHAPALNEICRRGTLDCQPIQAENDSIVARIGDAFFRAGSSGVSIYFSGSSKYFGEGTACGRDWTYSEDLTQAKSDERAKSKSSTTTSGEVVIKRKPVQLPRE